MSCSKQRMFLVILILSLPIPQVLRERSCFIHTVIFYLKGSLWFLLISQTFTSSQTDKGSHAQLKFPWMIWKNSNDICSLVSSFEVPWLRWCCKESFGIYITVPYFLEKGPRHVSYPVTCQVLLNMWRTLVRYSFTCVKYAGIYFPLFLGFLRIRVLMLYAFVRHTCQLPRHLWNTFQIWRT